MYIYTCLINVTEVYLGCVCVCVRIRMAGIRGLQGVVRKTVNDELQANIWDPQHMDKIVPSLLFNLQQEEGIERSETHLHARIHTITHEETWTRLV